jgi:hypothetical protein
MMTKEALVHFASAVHMDETSRAQNARVSALWAGATSCFEAADVDVRHPSAKSRNVHIDSSLVIRKLEIEAYARLQQ